MLIFLAGCMATESIDGEEDQERESPIGDAKNMMDKMIEEDFYAAWSLLNEETAAEISPEELEVTWSELVNSLGSYISYQYERTLELKESTETVVLTSAFETGDVAFLITVDQSKQICGFHIE